MNSPLVLLTNDDGIDAWGLRAMGDALRGHGFRVVVIAPDQNHTAGSHRVTIDRRLSLTRLEEPDTYLCDGTPVDCVRVGVLSRAVPRPDLVVAGVNHGANAGEDLHYSGTVSAAAEAAMLGVASLAVSQDSGMPGQPFLDESPRGFPDLRVAAQLAGALCQVRRPIDVFLSLNLPFAPTTSVPSPARVGRREWYDAGMRWRWTSPTTMQLDPWSDPPAAVDAIGTDYACLRDGIPSVSALSVRGGTHDVTARYSEFISLLIEQSLPKDESYAERPYR